MALKRENYTQMGLCILVYVLFILSLSAQNQACPIWADLEPIEDTRTATPTVYSQSVSIPFYDWEQLDSCRYSDNQYTTVELPGIKKSEMAIFSRWGHQIPDGATIQGIKLSIEGHQTGSGNIRDVKVQLQGSNENKADQYLGVAFPDSVDQVWRYGGENDTWGRNWSANQINSSNFGLVYQVRNSVSGNATVHIDQVSIEVFYTPMYTVCNDEHACVAFGVDEVDGYSYNWTIPQGFERLSSLNEQYAVNIGATSASFGTYNICVDIDDENGNFAENCCRTFRYKDCRPSFIGDQVFLDLDHDNRFSAEDEGVEGATVFLFDEFDNQMAFTTTDENGNYLFEVEQGSYYVRLELPDGTIPIEPNVGGDNADNDLDNSNGPLTTATFFAAAGSTVDNIDIGLAIELIIGDRVWEDKDYNGIQDSLEVGVADIEVLLLSVDGDTLQATTTDTDGIYGFDGIRVDDYEVRFVSEGIYWPTQQGIGTEDLDSDIDNSGSTGLIDFDVLDMPYIDIDAGFYRYASVGDYVFFDNNENGIQDAEDVPQDSILVTLSTATGVMIGNILTDDTGAYLFDSLTPGQYILTAEGSEFIKSTLALQGTDSAIDNDLHNEDGIYSTTVFMLMSNEINTSIDLGFRNNLAELGGFVFEDIKYDGQYDTADTLISNVIVQLKDMDGTVVQSKTTSVDGEYLFENVFPGTYHITFDAGSEYLFTQSNIGDETTDNDVTESIETGSTDDIEVTLGLEILDINAGVYKAISIGDYVFLDLNEDGIQNTGDTGLEGIELSILNTVGDVVASHITEANGAYIFDSLVPGEYMISLSSPDLYLATVAGVGTAATDSDLIDANGQYTSDVIATCSGQQIDTLDFGFINNYAQVSGQLFEDSKADGSLSITDTLIRLVPVTLYNTIGEIVQNTTTDVLGQYTFTDVLAGDYYIEYGLADSYIYTTSDVTESNGSGTTDVITLAPGQILNNLVTGAYIPASVGDFVFLDLDENGIQNAGDEGLAGLTMELRNDAGNLVSSLESSEDGSYVFANLIPGDYVINFVKDDLYLPALSNVGDAETDSDLLELGGLYTSELLTLCSGQQVDTIDFGFVNNYATVSGQVYEDSKADATFNAGDTAIINVTVTLYDTLNQVVQSTTTDAIGNFTFENIIAGDYYIQYGLSNAYVYSTSNVTESNGEGSTDRFTLTPGEIKIDEITGAYIPGSIGDYVFLDIDEDGIQGASDSGFAEVELSLLDASGTEVQTVNSSSDGSYSFDGLVPGDYTIALTISNLYLSTMSNIGDDELDSDLLGDAGNYMSPTITICSGQSDSTIDFGFVIDYATITGQVYEDSKADAVFNVGDTAIVNVPVTLYDTLDQVVQSTITDALGNYTFDDVLVGDYYIVYGLPSEYIYSTANVTETNGEGSTDRFTLVPGELKDDEITGAYILGYIGDYVFLDIDEDGIQGASDIGLAEIELSLLDASGTEVQTANSSSDGSYSFDGLEPGDYTIALTTSNLYLSTMSNIGDDELDSDLLGDAGNYMSPTITICSGQSDSTIDFGFVIDYATVTGQVYEDSKADAVFNVGDTAIVNVPVTLYDTLDQVVQSTVTDALGNYTFEDVLAGDYYILYGLPSEYIYSTANVTETNGEGSTDRFTLVPGELKDDEITGVYILGYIGDYVFLDINEDGIQGASDIGLAEIELSLLDASGTEVQTANSSSDGSYSFDGLEPGDYTIALTTSNLYLSTMSDIGDDELDSDLLGDAGNYMSPTITICSGQSDSTIDFGFIIDYATVTGQVYEDSKADAVFNVGDTAIVNVTVTLYDTLDQVVQSTVTDDLGNYTFEDVLAGDYYIVYGLSSEYIYSTANVTETNGEGSTDRFTLVPGELKDDEITGAYILGYIGDYVFLDMDENGIQGANDIGLLEIELSLLDASGTEVQTTNSSSDGSYSFDGLEPGDYTIALTTSDAYLSTMSNIGDDELDSDLLGDAGNYMSPTITICSGQSDSTIDFGFVIDYATISGQVYEDSKADAVFNVGDTAIVNVTVTLYDTLDQVVQSTVTDALGNYTFEDVLAGDYYIVYGLSSEYIYSTANVTETNGEGSTDRFTLVPGELKDDEITGAYILGYIGDYVFLDMDENGIQGANDIGLSEIELSLLDASGTEVQTTNSSSDGSYSFDELEPGDYTISLVTSDSYLSTMSNVGDDELDSDLLGDVGNYMSPTITICSGQSDSTIDFGFVIDYATISGQVYEDSKADSVFNDIDTTISNVLVSLYNSANEIVQTTTTDSDGSYTFEDVVAGNYYIVYGLASDYVYTSSSVTNTFENGSTDVFILTPGEVIINEAVGAYRPGTLGDYVFLDLNENGIQDDTDEGLKNIMLELYNLDGELVSVVISEPDGSYTLGNITPGQYSILAIASDEYLATLSNVGDDDMDSDLLLENGLLVTDIFTICSGQNNNSIDLGFVNNYAQITGSVFEDSKANGILDTPDTMKVGITVELFNTSNELVQSTMTAADGSYSFDNVLADDYYILYNLSSDYIFSTADVTGNNGVGSTDILTLAPGESLANEATGAYRNATIGDYVFLDQDDNGLQSGDDVGLSDVQLSLFNDQGVDQGMITSDENGNYVFGNLTPGKYIIQAQFEDLYIPTGYQQGDENLDSDLLEVAGTYVSDTITICSGQMIDNIDFGLANNYAKIGGVVFTDMMRDGQLMTIDEMLVDIPVTLFDSDNMEVASTVTDENGAYVFENIIAGNYYVVFDIGDRLFTLPNVGEDASDSDVVESNGAGSTAIYTLAPGECNLTVSAGAYERSSLGDYVWSDDNRDGLQNTGEPGIVDVVVNLYNNMDVFIAKDTTDTNGIYGFEGLDPGMYYIEVEYPEDLTATVNTNADTALNSDLTDANGVGTSDDIALTSGTVNLDIDVGLALAGAEIHGEVWVDLDGDEMQSIADTLLPYIPVKLFNTITGLEVFSTVTNQNGAYSFKPLDDGNYYVQFEITDTLVYVTDGVGSEALDSDVDDTNGVGTTDEILVVVGDVIWDVDAGVENGKSEISGLVFIDKNGDGVNDVSEINLDTYTVNVHETDGTIVRSVMSNPDGTYTIENIATGDYYLTFSIADDYEFTQADSAGDDTIDSDVTETQGEGSTDVISLGIQDAQVYDAGVYQLGSIGDFVWFDTDGNGLQDTDEPGVEFANLTILDMAGEAVDIVNTGADGAYLFDGLVPGMYWIFMQAPIGLKATTYQAGTDSDLDSDLLTDGAFLLSDTFMIMSGQDDLSIDFGLVENPGTIEGLVWNDIDVDGIFNDGITLFDAVTVELYTAGGTLESTTMTDADGGYIFNNVSPNDYYIKFVINDNTTFTTADEGTDDDVDSDVTSGGNGDGTTETFTLVSGQSIINIYAGLIFPAKIGNLAFLDENSNGIQDADEPGIPMLKVILYDENGVKLDSVITDVQGLYSFTDLDPANYYLEFVYPDAIQPTIAIPMMPALNSDITDANGEGTTDMVFLGSGVCNEDIDGGFVPSGAVIVGEVWLDTDGDDIQDNPNNPLEGIEVRLFSVAGGGTLVAGPVLTNELGIYGFSSVPTGSYYVEFEIADTLDFVNPNVGPADTDSDVTGAMDPGTTSPFIVLNGQLYDNVDAGVRDIRSIIQGQLFIDSDGDGVKDVNNQGLEGVTVTLYDITGTEVSSIMTTADGSYIFEGLLANSYSVEFSNYPSTYLFTEANVGIDDTVDSDIIITTSPIGSSGSFFVLLDQVITVDGGVYELASVGDYAWIDENNNGVQDPSELPLEGILVEATDASSSVVGSSTTDDEGMYLIEGLVPGTYNLIFNGVDNYIPTIANLGGDDTNDSDINVTSGQQAATGSFDLVSGENNIDFDGGYIFAQPSDGVISGLAWADSEGNGIREASNPRLPDIGVQLFNNLNVEQSSTTTNANGEYSFTGLSDGSYYVLFLNELGTSPTIPNVGDDLTDSDVTMANGGSSTNLINLGPSEVIENIDGGFIAVGAIGDHIFVDINGNGRKGSNEPGLNGVTVKLYDGITNELLKTTVSISDIASMEDGFYQFNDVEIGVYYVEFELPEPYLFTNPNSGSDDSIDSDVTGGSNGLLGSTDLFSLASGEIRNDIDAGAFLPAQIGDFVWDDMNENGIQDAGEPGIANIAVELKRSNTMLVASTTTDSNGNYCFDGLKQGLYFVEFEVPVGFVVTVINQGDSDQDSDVDATGTTPLVSIAHGSSFKEVDAGMYSQSINNLTSQVWFDEDLSGTYQEGESPIKDVVISLLDDQGDVMAQTTTNHAGKYAFINIPLGDYQVAVGIDDGFATTMMNAGNDDMIDSDVDASGMSAMFTVNNGLSVPNIDVGMIEDDGIIPEVTGEEESLTDVDLVEDELDQEEIPITFVSGPNPFYNRVQIRMSKLVNGVAYSIYRLDGGLVQSGTIIEQDQWIELEKHNDGMYILVITHNDVPVDKQYLMKVH